MSLLLAAAPWLACTVHGQRGDTSYVPVGASEPRGQGVTVTLDEAHFNFHTRAGRYAPFAAELEAAGYLTASNGEAFSLGSLSKIEVLVIANALAEASVEDWSSPTPSAFTGREIEAVATWVEEGGRLLLIADHMPFPGAAAGLAEKLGFRFHNGFLFEGGTQRGVLNLTHEGGLLDSEPLRGYAPDSLHGDQVRVFTGQAFEALAENAQAVLRTPAGSEILLPEEAWEFSDTTERTRADGMLMGALRKIGQGRVAVFGEAAMFTSQVARRDGVEIRVGLSHPEATGNAALLHGVVAWLSEGLQEP